VSAWNDKDRVDIYELCGRSVDSDNVKHYDCKHGLRLGQETRVYASVCYYINTYLHFNFLLFFLHTHTHSEGDRKVKSKKAVENVGGFASLNFGTPLQSCTTN
jgi:hypothetical protein